MDVFREENRFAHRRQLLFSDCDRNKNMKLSAILRLSGELAGHDLTDRGIPHQKLWDAGMVFLLTRIAVRINRLPRELDEITELTWEHSIKGAQFLRGYEIQDDKGEKLLDGISCWVLVNPQTRQILRPKEYKFSFTLDEWYPLNATMPTKIELDNPIYAGQRQVYYSDIDANGHCYNAVYGDIICDFAPIEVINAMEKDCIGAKGLRVNFIHEAVLGDKIDIYYQLSKDDKDEKNLQGEKSCLFYGSIGGKRCFEAAIEL